MVRRQDRPLLQVQVSFEATRLGPQHLIAAYTHLVPIVRRTNARPKRDDGTTTATITTMAAGGET